MPDIKILKQGLSDYDSCMKKINEKFNELNNLELSLYKKLSDKDWQGKTRDKCEILLKLTTSYKKKIKVILDDMNRQEQELKQNVNDFTRDSSAVKILQEGINEL